jgi:hypothetical protein
MTRTLLMVGVVAVFGASSCKGEKPIYFQCNYNADSLVGDVGTKYKIECPQLCSGGSVWGTDTYTSDSSVCAAAIHAGVLKETGGTASVIIKAGEKTYKGSKRNGIVSSDYKAWERSFGFD